jgi:glyoxylase-like metal-dependent hydrolase (beta-lactamase superfamily II)
MITTFSGRSPLTADLLKDAKRRPADVTFDREFVVDLGGVGVRFLLVGPTHTRGDTGLFVEGDNVLFAGDVVMNNSYVAAMAASSIKRGWRHSTRSRP